MAHWVERISELENQNCVNDLAEQYCITAGYDHQRISKRNELIYRSAQLRRGLLINPGIYFLTF